MKRKALIIFVKFPEPGKVKTRLASDTNDSFALKFYNAIAQNTFEVVEKLDASIDKYVFNSPISDIQLVKNWINRDFYYAEQRGTNLGKKISNAFKDLFEDGYEKIVIVGSDVPDISESLLQNAYDVLEKRNVVISPSEDGGYSLLGMDHHYPMLFENIEWSSDKVFTATKSIISENKLSEEILEELNDIDTKNDLLDWMGKSVNSKLSQKIKSFAREENIEL